MLIQIFTKAQFLRLLEDRVHHLTSIVTLYEKLFMTSALGLILFC